MKRIITALLLFAATSTVYAQETQDTVELREIVVTATRVQTPRAEVSAAVTVIQGDELRRRGIRTVDEALSTVSGAAIVQSGSYGAATSLFLRGGESDYVQVLIDGVQVNSPGEQFNWAGLAIEDVDRIEIVKGPVSVLYGSDAVTGVVQLFTKQRAGKTRADLALSAGRGQKVGPQSNGSFDNATLRADIGGGTGAFVYSAGVSHFNTEGAYAFNNRHRNTSVTTRAGWSADARTSLGASVRYAKNRFHYPTDGAGQLNDSNQYRESESVVAGLDLTRKFTDRLDIRASIGLNDNGDVSDDAPDDAADTIGFFRFRLDERFQRQAADVHLNYRIGSRATVTAGTEYETQQYRTMSSSPFGDEPETTYSRNNLAGYAQWLATFGRLSFQAGVRGEDNEKFGTFMTYRGGVTSQVTSALRLRANAGTAFKEPRFFEQFAQGFVVGNPSLNPERSRSIEGGADAAFGRFTLSAAYYSQRFTDLIQYVSVPSPGSPNYSNLAEARANGLELDASLRMHPVTLTANYTNLDTRVIDAGTGEDPSFEDGQSLLRRPRHSGSIGVSANAARLNVGVTGRYVGERADLDFSGFPSARVSLPAYTRMDATAEYAVRTNVHATLRVDNVLDAAYQEVLNFAAPGRVVFVGIRAGN